MDDTILRAASASATTTTAAAPKIANAARAPAQRRMALVQWLRKAHGWIGLWGAILGLTFGITGIWLNHRAVLKLPPVAQQREASEVALPDPAPENAEAMRAWLQGSLGLKDSTGTVRVERAKAVPWMEKGGDAKAGGKDTAAPQGSEATGAAGATATKIAPLMQPEHWTFNFTTPDVVIQAEYWMGNKSVGVRTTRNGFMATLMNFHKGVGMTTAWILLVDTLAGSLILLSLTGLLLWTLTNRRKVVGAVIAALSVLTTLGLIAVSMQA